MTEMLSIAPKFYETFLRTVVRRAAFGTDERQRSAGPLPDKTAKMIAEKKRIDHRTPWLMTVSGKGGFVPGSAFADRERFRNISLLDHLVSVARGAAVFAELDLRAAGIEDVKIRPRIALLIAVGFLHDADKILKLSRTDDMTPANIEGLMARYRITEYLEASGVRLAPADLLSMIHAVEVTRSGTLKPGMRLLSVEEMKDCAYVRLADRLEGLFLDSTKGIDAMVAELNKFGGFRSDVFAFGWRSVRVRSAHTPFLLNELQRGVSAEVMRLSGMPPLLEIHHDGELLAIFPEPVADEAIDGAINRAIGRLRLGMRVMTNPRGTRDILDGGSDVQDILSLLDKTPSEASKALFIHVDLLEGPGSVRDRIDELLTSYGFPANFAGKDKFTGRHFQSWPVRDGESENLIGIRRDAGALAIGLGCAEPKRKDLAVRVPDAACREAELAEALEATEHEIPDCLTAVKHSSSRQTLLAAVAAALADKDEVLYSRLFGGDGLLHLWLCGDGAGRAGLLEKIGDPGAVFRQAASDWLHGAIARRFIAAGIEESGRRCHFTNFPVGPEACIDTASGLDGIKVSAFSGREGRPESFQSTKKQTLVSAPAAAEHRLRTILGEGRSGGDVPAYISTPTMMGLFANLHLGNIDDEFLQINHYDLVRLEAKPRYPVFPEAETYGHHLMFARHVSIPTNTMEIIRLARMMMESALRIGRPVHVFKGLPTSENGFVYFNFLPGAIERGLEQISCRKSDIHKSGNGGRSLRLEQIPEAIKLMKNMEDMGTIPNLGLEVALRYADPRTRFAAACETLAVLNRLHDDKINKLISLKMTLQTITRSSDIPMTQTDNVIIEFARAMTRIQDAPSRDASNAERTLGLKIALEAVEGCATAIKQAGTETLIAAIAGTLENEFERSSRRSWRGKNRGYPFPRKATKEAATLFVERVWPVAFRSRPPASKARRIAMAVYQVAFENESYRRREKSDPSADQAPETVN